MRKGKRYLWAGIVFAALALMLSVPALAATPVGQHGKLSVKGSQIVDSKGQVFQLKGVSTHGLSWYPQYVSKAAFKSLRDDWGANAVRLAMYTADYNGYCTGSVANRKELKALIDKGVTAATELGMYVIIDWHILSDGNPNTYRSKAVSFFKEMAQKYKNYDNVIYEICNEPNGGTSWSQIKTYASKVIPAIRKIDKDAIIVVGTPNWSQDVDTAVKSPITGYSNIAYSFHFYAGTHKASYRTKLESAVKAGLPVIVTEFGISDASGSGSVSKSEGTKWVNLLNKYGIGYVCWNLSNKNETSALIKSSSTKTSGWKLSELTTSGKWLVSTLNGSLSTSGSSTSSSSTSSSSTSSSTSSGASGSTSQKTRASSAKSVKASKKYCSLTLKKAKTWKSGNRYYTLYRLTIKNKSSYKISSWKVQVKFSGSIKKSQYWNGKMMFKGRYVTIKPVSWNKTIAAKGKVTDIGFIVSSTSKSIKAKSVVFK